MNEDISLSQTLSQTETGVRKTGKDAFVQGNMNKTEPEVGGWSRWYTKKNQEEARSLNK